MLKNCSCHKYVILKQKCIPIFPLCEQYGRVFLITNTLPRMKPHLEVSKLWIMSPDCPLKLPSWIAEFAQCLLLWSDWFLGGLHTGVGLCFVTSHMCNLSTPVWYIAYATARFDEIRKKALYHPISICSGVILNCPPWVLRMFLPTCVPRKARANNRKRAMTWGNTWFWGSGIDGMLTEC